MTANSILPKPVVSMALTSNSMEVKLNLDCQDYKSIKHGTTGLIHSISILVSAT